MNETQTSSLAETLLNTQRPLIISGPCSAETEEQLLTTAQHLKNTGKVHMLRAGIWKPRTRPGSFEGVGTKGLGWLQKAKLETGLPTAVEVATAKQVEDALHFDVDVLWIGARTTVNPFSVQEVADAVRGVNIPVLIKNPINPDIELWTGALERFSKVGIKTLGLIHRGFSTYGNTKYRNPPMWHLAIEMRLRHPHILMINDPSHICGSRTHLLQVAQQAVNLNFDGLMIESHIDPDKAWSDAKQQILPTQLAAMIDQIVWKKESTQDDKILNALEGLREQIDHLDSELIQLLGKRMKISRSIGELKRVNNVTILQPSRWQQIVQSALEAGKELKLSNEFIVKIFENIHLESIEQQNSFPAL